MAEAGRPKPTGVLLVEDDPDHAQLITRALRESDPGGRVARARDGEETPGYPYRRDRHAARSAVRPRLMLLGVCRRVRFAELIERIEAVQADWPWANALTEG